MTWQFARLDVVLGKYFRWWFCTDQAK